MDKTKKVVSKEPAKAHLKAERVQDTLLRKGWSPGLDGAGMVRTREFGDVEDARAFVGNVCRISAMWHHPVQIGFSEARVVVTLQGFPAFSRTGGFTKAVLKLAEMIG